MMDAAEVAARIGAYQTPEEDDSQNDGAGLGALRCGCYYDSGVYKQPCRDHDPDIMANTLITHYAALQTENARLTEQLRIAREAITAALEDYDCRDELSAIDGLRAALTRMDAVE